MTDSDDLIAAADASAHDGLFKEAHIDYGKALGCGTTRESYCRQMRGMCSRRVAEVRLEEAQGDPRSPHILLVQAARWLAKAEANLESSLEGADRLQRGHIRLEQALTDEAIARFMRLSGGDPRRRLSQATGYRREATRILGEHLAPSPHPIEVVSTESGAGESLRM